jgi:hypothetical protein
MSSPFVRSAHVVMVTDGRWRRYWAVASSRERAVAIVEPLIPTGYKATLANRRLTLGQVVALKLRAGEAKELMYEPKTSN